MSALDHNSDVNAFINQLESSARGILKAANKKQREQRRIEQSQAIMEGRRVKSHEDSKVTEREFSTSMIAPASVGKGGKANKLLSATSTSASFDSGLAGNPMDATRVMKFSIPQMSVSMSVETVDLKAMKESMGSSDGRRISSAGMSKLLSPIKSQGGGTGKGSSSSASASAMASSALSAAAAVTSSGGGGVGVGGATTTKRNLVLEKLQASPFIPPSETLDGLLDKLKKSRDPSSLAKGPCIESAWDLKLHAASVLGGTNSSSASGVYKKIVHKKQQPDPAIASEPTGPMDWTFRGIKSKYRGEAERERLWHAWFAASNISAIAYDTQDTVIPVVPVDRHPMIARYFEQIKVENDKSTARTRKRLLVRKFVLDVREVWLTNLQHLFEHQPGNLLSAGMVDPATGEVSRLDESAIQADGPLARQGGLHARRDIPSIAAMDHQIQSVAPYRATEKAYHNASLFDPYLVLDYEPLPTPKLQPPPPNPPFLEPLVSDFIMKTTFINTVDRVYKVPDRSQHPIIDSDVMLFVDRLIPSCDHETNSSDDSVSVGGRSLLQEVLWRITLIRRRDVHTVSYMARETDVAAWVAKMMLEEVPHVEPMMVYETSSLSLLSLDQTEHFLAELVVSITLKPYRKSQLMEYGDEPPLEECKANEMMDIEVHVLLTESGQEIGLMTNPVELCRLLDARAAPLDDYAWWTDNERANDIWLLMLSILRVDVSSKTSQRAVVEELTSAEEDDDDENEVGQKNSERDYRLCFGYQSSPADRIPGALTQSEAYSCAHELVSLLCVTLSVSDDLSARLPYGADMNLFTRMINPEDVPEGVECMSVNSLDTSSLEAIAAGPSWEEEADTQPCLSLRLSGGDKLVAHVPGASEIGKMGIWFPPPRRSHEERTRAAATFFRDATLSTSDSVLVLLTLALDTPVIFPTTIAWEGFSTVPPRSAFETVLDNVPALIVPPGTILKEPVISAFHDRGSTRSMVFITMAEQGFDYMPLDAPRHPSGMKRQLSYLTRLGFRQKVQVLLLGVDPVVATSMFGITKKGATMNVTGVNPRNVWHATIAVVEHINRPRVPTDYHNMLTSYISCGSNDACAFNINLKGGEFVGLTPTQSKAFQAEYSEIDERRKIFARQLALDTKIEKSEMTLRIRDKELKNQIQKELQRTLEKKLRKGTRSEVGWRKRFNMSTLMEVQGNWERRRDDRTGLIFFRKLVPRGVKDVALGLNREKYLDTCQWEIPSAWDGDPLGITEPPSPMPPTGALGSKALAGGPMARKPDDGIPKKPGAAENALQVMTGKVPANTDFTEPDDTWLPIPDDGGLDMSLTPGVEPKPFHRPTKENMQDKLPKPLSQALAAISSGGGGDRSVGGDSFATIDTVQLEHIAEQLVSSDELMRVIAKRLGLPVSQVVPAQDMSSVFSIDDDSTSMGDKDISYQGLDLAPREHHEDIDDEELESDDDLWSDDDDIEAGDVDEDEAGILAKDRGEMAMMKRKLAKKKSLEDDVSAGSVPSHVPFLNLLDKGLTSSNSDDNPTVALWRALPRPVLGNNFFQKCVQTKTHGPDPGAANTSSKPIFLVPISPVDAIQYVPTNFEATVNAIFVPNHKKEMERAVATLERNIRKEEELAQNIPTDDLLLFGEAKETTKLDGVIHKQYSDDQAAVKDPREAAIDKAIWAAKANNVAAMEDALEEQIHVDTTDQFGNSLFLLAAQQGSKRMCKFLLRRGAAIDWQNTSGNTAMHYCYAYNNAALGDYLKSRGANDSLLNVDGMTCYEGLSKEYLKEGGEDEDEASPENQMLLGWK